MSLRSMEHGQPTQTIGWGTRRLRWTAAIILVVLTSVSLVGTVAAYWNKSVALDTDGWMDVVEPVLSSEEFTDALSVTATDAVLQLLGVEAALRGAVGDLDLPETGPVLSRIITYLGVPSLEEMATFLLSEARDRLESSVAAILDSEAVQGSVNALIRRSHAAFVTLATEDIDELPALYVQDGVVMLNTLSLSVSLAERIVEERLLGDDLDLTFPDLSDNPVASVAIGRISDAIDIEIPEGTGQVPLMTEAQLDTLQNSARLLNRLVWGLAVVTVAFAAGALAVSPDRRRTVVHLGIGAVLGLLASYLVIVYLVGRVQQWFIDPGAAATFEALVGEVTASIRGLWLLAALGGLIAWLAAYLVGRWRPQSAAEKG